jgi:hypothetical protein
MPVAVKPVIDTSDLRRAGKLVREIDPRIRSQLIKDAKADMTPFAEEILSKIPTRPPLSGMGHTGRTGWAPPKYSLHVTPGGGRGSLARIEVYSKSPFGPGFKIADLVGTRNRGERVRRAHVREVRGKLVQVKGHPTKSGDVLIQRMSSRYPLSANGKGGRFVWAGAMDARPQLIARLIVRLDEYAERIERGAL